MALRFPAAFDLQLANSVQLGLIERDTLPLTCPPLSVRAACPSADDLLGFCDGSLPAPRAVAVQHHLDLCPACLDIATLAVNDWEPRQPAPWLDVASNFHPGDCVDDRYEIVRFLASGGMGEVYEALDRRRAERVALKAVLAATCDNRELLRSFRREARLARRVRHPNVCHVRRAPSPDVITRPLVPYFVMELIDGDTLHERLCRGPLPFREALHIAHQVLLGIQAIHRAGVLHLDIKSNNIMLRRGPEPRAVILDFGLARRARDAENTRVRPLTGSLPFIPPEQLLGRAPGVQNDIFAFGVVLFQMLTGELPFSQTRGTPASSIAERLTARAPAPSEVVAAVPSWLDALVLRCLSDLDTRYRDASDVLEAFTGEYAPANARQLASTLVRKEYPVTPTILTRLEHQCKRSDNPIQSRRVDGALGRAG